jgi:hypothetical protein
MTGTEKASNRARREKLANLTVEALDKNFRCARFVVAWAYSEMITTGRPDWNCFTTIRIAPAPFPKRRFAPSKILRLLYDRCDKGFPVANRFQSMLTRNRSDLSRIELSSVIAQLAPPRLVRLVAVVMVLRVRVAKRLAAVPRKF